MSEDTTREICHICFENVRTVESRGFESIQGESLRTVNPSKLDWRFRIANNEEHSPFSEFKWGLSERSSLFRLTLHWNLPTEIKMRVTKERHTRDTPHKSRSLLYTTWPHSYAYSNARCKMCAWNLPCSMAVLTISLLKQSQCTKGFIEQISKIIIELSAMRFVQ